MGNNKLIISAAGLAVRPKERFPGARKPVSDGNGPAGALTRIGRGGRGSRQLAPLRANQRARSTAVGSTPAIDRCGRTYRRSPRMDTLTFPTLMLAPDVVELLGLVQLHTAFGNAPPIATSRIKKNPWSTTSFQYLAPT